ncbi:MAG: hypothetical protein ABGZ35_26490, partial [Planctomycetaceae bacterium]
CENYRLLGELLAATGEFFRDGGLNCLIYLGPGNVPLPMTKGVDLYPRIVDRVRLAVVKNGKNVSSILPATHLNSMLKSESFLARFPAIDRVSICPLCLQDFSVTRPGFNDGGPGYRILYVGERPKRRRSKAVVNQFLDVMDFASNADRTNTVAFALTVVLRNHFPGGKPIGLVTANKSHAGKDTIIAFAHGLHRATSISYQATNWALEHNFVMALKANPDTGVVNIENARIESRQATIASAFIERFATDPEPLLSTPGTGEAVRRRNDIVLAISTNYGSVSEDIVNRSLPIHLDSVGDIPTRKSPIGNPKLEFLPRNKEAISAELFGMIERWKSDGMPFDEEANHPFSPWARTVGGILKANGYEDFLGNYGVRKSTVDPVRQGLAILGSDSPGKWLRVDDWALAATRLGLIKTVVPSADQCNEAGHRRGLGVVMSAHRDESFFGETDSATLSLCLQKGRKRFDGQAPHVRYRFELLNSEAIPEDCDADNKTTHSPTQNKNR